MPPALSIGLITLLAVLLMMAGEAVLSAVNAAELRKRGAIEPAATCIARCDGRIRCRSSRWRSKAPRGGRRQGGAARWAGLFGLAKALKLWAITTLGPRW